MELLESVDAALLTHAFAPVPPLTSCLSWRSCPTSPALLIGRATRAEMRVGQRENERLLWLALAWENGQSIAAAACMFLAPFKLRR
jgi:hypothetical protein